MHVCVYLNSDGREKDICAKMLFAFHTKRTERTRRALRTDRMLSIVRHFSGGAHFTFVRLTNKRYNNKLYITSCSSTQTHKMENNLLFDSRFARYFYCVSATFCVCSFGWLGVCVSVLSCQRVTREKRLSIKWVCVHTLYYFKLYEAFFGIINGLSVSAYECNMANILAVVREVGGWYTRCA